MKENATLIAIGGVVILGLGMMVLSGFTKQAVDPELVKLIVTGLVGFASGAGVVGVTKGSDKVEVKE